MEVVFGKKKVEIGDARKVGALGKIFGLMFRTKNTGSLLFEFRKEGRRAIHSYFVFFDFLAVWLTYDNNVVEIKKVRPFSSCVYPKLPFKKLLEIPFNDRNEAVVKKLVGKERFK